MKNKTEYDIQAEKFLNDFNLNISISKANPQKNPLWTKKGENHGIHYWVELTNIREINPQKRTYGFDFWDSIHNKENNKKLKEYDILACLNIEEENLTFEDFCSNYGYDIDSKLAKKTYNQVIEQNNNLKNILSIEAQEALNEIN